MGTYCLPPNTHVGRIKMSHVAPLHASNQKPPSSHVIYLIVAASTNVLIDSGDEPTSTSIYAGTPANMLSDLPLDVFANHLDELTVDKDNWTDIAEGLLG